MKIVLGLSREDINEVRELKSIADASVRYLKRKQGSDAGLTRQERKELNRWLRRQKIFNRIKILAANEMAAIDTRKADGLVGTWDEVAAILAGVIAGFRD